jgi:hypothetical protein
MPVFSRERKTRRVILLLFDRRSHEIISKRFGRLQWWKIMRSVRKSKYGRLFECGGV